MAYGRPPDHSLRALVVAYDFPPHAAIGTMRTLRLVQQLATEGWDVTVLTSDPSSYRPNTPVDEALLARVPAGVRVVRARAVRAFDALKRRIRVHAPRTPVSEGESRLPAVGRTATRSRLGRAADLIDAALTIPDPEAAWFAPALVRGAATCRYARPDVIYSSGPPWTGHIVARVLAGAFRLPWMADFRDPWVRAPWRGVRRRFVTRTNVVLERSVIHRADAVLFVTRANLAEFSTVYPESVERFHLVPNGCDPTEFDTITAAPSQSGTFVMLHAGTLYGARNPLPLLQAVARAFERGALDRNAFRLRFVGTVSLDVDLMNECRRLGIEDIVELRARIPRRDGLREMVSASALLLVQPRTTVSVPGKAYEYLAAGRPVLALAEEAETAQIVRASGIGVSVAPDAGVHAVEAALLEVIDLASQPFAPPPAHLYDGRVHAGTAARLLADLAQRRRHTTGTRIAVTATADLRAKGSRR